MIARVDGLVAADVDGETVILSVDNGYFYQLNKTGSRIWDAIAEPVPLTELCVRLQERFAVDPELCRRDVVEFVEGMIDKGLLRNS